MIGQRSQLELRKRLPAAISPNPRVIFAGLAYFAWVFVAGFLLGALRVFLIAPRTGELVAVALELPIMLLISWAAAGALIRRFGVSPKATDRMTMGVVGFALLQAAETALGVWGFGRAFQDQIAAWVSAPGLVGLAGQVAFALFPILIGRGRGD